MESKMAAGTLSDRHAHSIAARQGVRLEYFTVVWMTAEAVLAIAAGIAARSVLLTAFGADSVIELISGATLLWRLRVESARGDDRRVKTVERRATFVSAFLLVILCAYVALSSAAGLIAQVEPERSWLGIAVSAAAVVVMPVLAWRKRVVNVTLQSSALRADIAESVTCAYLGAVTLLGVGIDAATGWGWIEYIAALVLLWWLIREAQEAVEASRERHPTEDRD
jgi:divalent metal cation (Fe/Co/Zn/Cd) transporter